MSDDLIKRLLAEETDLTDCAVDRIEQLQAKLIIAVAYIRRHIPDSIYEQRQQARSVLAELEKSE
jgi:hypothetical protein